MKQKLFRLCRQGAAIALVAVPALGSCEKEVVRYDEMCQYHTESLTLQTVTPDSVGRFSEKVASFVAQHPAAADDPLYPEIQQNIRQARLRITITVNGEWEGEFHAEF